MDVPSGQCWNFSPALVKGHQAPVSKFWGRTITEWSREEIVAFKAERLAIGGERGQEYSDFRLQLYLFFWNSALPLRPFSNNVNLSLPSYYQMNRQTHPETAWQNAGPKLFPCFLQMWNSSLWLIPMCFLFTPHICNQSEVYGGPWACVCKTHPYKEVAEPWVQTVTCEAKLQTFSLEAILKTILQALLFWFIRGLGSRWSGEACEVSTLAGWKHWLPDLKPLWFQLCSIDLK